MTSQKSYYELLKDPRWQRKRLEVMQRAEFTCEYCEAEDRTLNIHHTYYQKGLTPWEYPDESLICLCEPCHKHAQNRHTAIQECLGQLGVHDDLDQLIGYANGLIAYNQEDAGILVSSYAEAQGVGHVFQLTAETVIEALHDGWIDGHKLRELQDQKAYESFAEFYKTHDDRS